MLKTLLPEHWWPRLQDVHADPHEPPKEWDTLTFLQGDNGNTIAAFPVPNFYRLQRSKLRALLSEELDIRHEKRLANITYAQDHQSVTAHFSDGTTATGSILIGADGARSTVRHCLLGPQLSLVNTVPYCATFVESSFSKEQALFLRSFHPLYLASAHPDNHFGFFSAQHIADPEDPTTWIFKFYISWQSSHEEQEATAHWTDAQRLAQQKELAKKFCDPWKSAYEWTPDDTPVWYMAMTEWDPGMEGHRWDSEFPASMLSSDKSFLYSHESQRLAPGNSIPFHRILTNVTRPQRPRHASRRRRPSYDLPTRPRPQPLTHRCRPSKRRPGQDP